MGRKMTKAEKEKAAKKRARNKEKQKIWSPDRIKRELAKSKKDSDFSCPKQGIVKSRHSR